MTNHLSQKILGLMKTKKMSYRALAKAANLGETGVRDIVVGRSKNPQLSTLSKIASALGVTVTDLTSNENSETDPSDELREPTPTFGIVEINDVEFASIPRYDASLSAGPGSIIDPNAEPIGYHLIEAQWLNAVTRAAPQNLAVIRVSGDSMEDTLSNGDWVLLDRTQTRAAEEGIYALQIDDTTWVKRLTLNLRERLIRVVSDNPKYPVQDLPADDLTVVGRVVCIVARKV